MSDTDPFDAKMMEAGILPPPDSPPEPAATEPPPEAASSSQETETLEAPEFAAPADGLLAGKYPDQDALVKGYKELEREFHERNQKLAEYEKQQAEYAELEQQGQYLPQFAQESQWSTDELANWEAYAMQGAQQSREVLDYVLQNEASLGFEGQRFKNQIAQIYASHDMFGAMQYAYEQAAQPQIQQTQELQAAHLHQVIEQSTELADARAKQELPDYAKWSPMIGQWLADNPQFVQGFVTDTSPDTAFRALSVAYDVVRSMYARQQFAAAQQAATTPPAASTKTQTKSSAAKPTDDSPDRAFARAIIEADF